MSDIYKIAPEGQVWVCAACGKKSRTRSGFDSQGKRTAIDNTWDESCMLNAVLCYERKLNETKWTAVEETKPE